MCLLSAGIHADGQEHAGPLGYNPRLLNQLTPPKTAKKTTTSLSLPFFEDFTGYGIFPDHSRWVENQVYINNTMCVSPISRGVATFDALNEHGLPWNPLSNSDFSYTDSLTSQPIDLSIVTPADSLYLSFFYQPQGNGFYPLPADSLFLFMRIRYGDWVRVWKAPGSTLHPFTQVMIPITDTLYFYSDFQFRFVNIAALNYSDAVWNLDYVRLDKNRNMADTAINDIAFSADPTFLLNDYTSMPYRQFYANPIAERASQYTDSIHNNYTTPQSVTYGFSASELSTGAVLQPLALNNSIISPGSISPLLNSAYSATIPPPTSLYDKVVFENKYFVESSSTTGSVPNDTIIRDQVFDNYLAYDDGTAEQSYYLSLFPTLPGKIAIEHHLNIPDTMRGMAIYFGRQTPSVAYKPFSIVVYSQLAGVNGAVADNLLYIQDPCNPGYADTINHYWIYKFDNPLPLPAGTFYAGAFMPAESGSDSLYFGLDMNRIGGNHAYYNVLASWNPSLIHGAIMMRPLLGQSITSSKIVDAAIAPKKTWEIFPNPASDDITLHFDGDRQAGYVITNIQGQVVLTGNTSSGISIDISSLNAGMYFVNITRNGIAETPKKIIKL